METSLSQAFRAATGKANARNGGSTGTVDNVGNHKEPRIDRKTPSLIDKTLWRKRTYKGARVHERDKKE